MPLGAAWFDIYLGGRATNRARGSQILPTPDELRMPKYRNCSECGGAKVTAREGKNPDLRLRSLSES